MAPVQKKPKIDGNEHIGVTRFREYLRINTMQPTPDYIKCSQFLKTYAKELQLEYKEVEMVKGKPIVILTLAGSDPKLKSIILNSHTDVVPVDLERWDHDPFEAYKDENGNIFARGSQDMKCVGIWYMEAIRKIKDANFKLKRTLHLTFVPDEEIGGHDGMELFVKSKEFKQLNAGFALDEGLANEENAFKVYYGERSPWWIKLTARGNAGHASKFIEPSATERLLKVLQKFSDFRESEKSRLELCKDEHGKALTLGDVTSANITLLNGSVQFNVVPAVATAGVDMRVNHNIDFDLLEAKIKGWCAAEHVEVSYQQKTPKTPPTVLNETNREWKVLQAVASKLHIELQPEIFPAATDSRFLRQHGIPALGISAIKNTPVLLHDHNEYLNEQVFIDGIDFYFELISGIANLSA